MTMHTKRLCIRRFRPEDLDALFRLLSDEAVMKDLEPPYTREQAEAFLHRFGLSECPLVYAVEDREGAFVGYVIYHPYDKDSYELGWVLRKDRWGRGYARELTQCLIEDAKSKTKQLVIECAPSQIVTKGIAQRFRFSFTETKDGLDVYTLHFNGSEE